MCSVLRLAPACQSIAALYVYCARCESVLMMQATRRSLVDLMAHHCQSLDLASTAEHARLQLNLICSLLFIKSSAATEEDRPGSHSQATTEGHSLKPANLAATGTVSAMSDSQATTRGHSVATENLAVMGNHAQPGQQAFQLTERWWQAYMQQITQAVAENKEVELLYKPAPLYTLLGTLPVSQSLASQFILAADDLTLGVTLNATCAVTCVMRTAAHLASLTCIA